MKFDWFRDARLKLVTREARKQASDTDELWQQLRARFPVQAWAIAPVRVPERWLMRDPDGRVQAIVIGG